jgi:hypothetical protein
MNVFIIAPSRSGHNWIASMIQSWNPILEIVDLENISPERAADVYNLQSGKVVLVTRDLLNWYASRKRGSITYSLSPLPPWEQITAEFYYLTQYLLGYGAVRIKYEDFFTSAEYRHSICDVLGGVYNEKKLGFMPPGGRGSSFSRLEYQGRAQELGTLTRYTQVPARLYLNLFKNRPDLLDFYYQYQATEESLTFLKSLKL